MKTCARCGRENQDSSAFCSYCGRPFTPDSEAQEIGDAPTPPGPAYQQGGPYAPAPPPSGPSSPYPQQTYPSGTLYQAPYHSAPPRNNGKATASLVLGIIGLFVCPLICSVMAIILGGSAKNEIAAGAGREGGEGLATAGIILGWLGVVFSVIWIIIFAVVAASSNAVLIPFFAR